MSKLPEIPATWTIFILVVGLVILRAFGIDTWTTAAISTLVGYLTGKHIEQTRTIQPVAVRTEIN
jgi:hypothetical protein